MVVLLHSGQKMEANSKCPPNVEWINTMGYIHKMELYSATERKTLGVP